MRVIAGTARRLLLNTIEGIETRPTQDRIKETLFNMLNVNLQGSTFLDLYSGSGAIGIEALSRGASHGCFVENNKSAVQCIYKNLEHTKLVERASVMQTDVQSALRLLEDKNETFDFIFMDPPYGKAMEQETLLQLNESKLVNEETLIIVEADLNTTFDYLESTKLQIIKEKTYKTNKHIFIELGGTRDE